MIGAVAGDMIGSVYEARPVKTKDFPLFGSRSTFTDDTVLTVAVPEAILSFLESSSFEDAVRTAISLGGDSDTLACIAGGIAEAFYGEAPDEITQAVRARLPEDLLSVIDRFYRTFPNT